MCAALGSSLASSPTALLAALGEEMTSHTPQGTMSAATLVLQLLVLTGAVHVVIDTPAGADGALWGATD